MVWILSGYRRMCQWWAGALNQHVDHGSCSPGLCLCSLLTLELGECLGDALSASVGCQCPWLRVLCSRERLRVTGEGEMEKEQNRQC